MDVGRFVADHLANIVTYVASVATFYVQDTIKRQRDKRDRVRSDALESIRKGYDPVIGALDTLMRNLASANRTSMTDKLQEQLIQARDYLDNGDVALVEQALLPSSTLDTMADIAMRLETKRTDKRELAKHLEIALWKRTWDRLRADDRR